MLRWACLLSLPSLGWAKPSYIVMPYLPTWSGGITNATIPWNDITYVAEAFGLPQPNGAMPTFAAPGQRAGLITTAHANNTYVMYSMGGATGSLANWTSSTTAGNLNTFVTNIMNIVQTYGYDGVDIDWEFPAVSDRTQFTNLMVALGDALKNPGNPNYKGTAFDGTPKKLSFYISPGYYICGVDWNSVPLQNAVDFAVLPGYDICAGPGWEGPINGPWTFTDCSGASVGLTVAGNMNKLSSGGRTFPKSKFVLGMPFYNCAGSTLEAVTAGGSHTSLDATTLESIWSGAYINDSYAYCAKMTWAASQGFKGIAMWELSQAYPRNGTAEVALTWDRIGGVSGGCWPSSGTPTFTATRTRTPTPTRTATPTSTRTPAGTSTFTSTRSPTPSNTPVVSATSTVTPTRTATPWVVAVPGRIQAEDYNAWSDTTAGNTGAVYRTDDVDIEATTDAGGGYNVGYVVTGEWLEYVVQVSTTGTYDFTFRVAANSAVAHSVQMQLDGSNLGPAAVFPNTGGWQTWTNVTLAGLALTAGTHTLRLNVTGGDFNFNYLDVLLTATPTSTRTPTATSSRTPTPTASASSSATATPTRTASPSATSTGTLTRTATGTVTPSSTGSSTGTATRTVSPTPSSSSTSTPGSTATSTSSPTRTVTPSASVTSTASRTATPSSSATPSLTTTPTRSSTPTATPTVTASATNTLGASPTSTLTPTASVTPTASRTPTPSTTATPTLTATPTRSSTPTATATPSISPTSSATGTNTAGPSPTSTATPSASGTPTPSPSPTSTASSSATATPSATASPTGTTTPSSTASPTRSSTPTSSPTASATPTSSASPTPSASATASSTNTPGPSPTYSSTSTPSATGTASGTATPSATASASATATPSATPTRSSTASPTVTATPTISRTGTMTATPTITATPTATATSSATPLDTATVTPGPSGTSTPSPSSTQTSLPTAVPSPPSGGPPVLEQAWPVPHPQSGPWLSLRLKLSGGTADKVRVKLYTRAFTAVADLEVQGSYPAGWQSVTLPWPAHLGKGHYFLACSASNASGRSAIRVLSLVRLGP